MVTIGPSIQNSPNTAFYADATVEEQNVAGNWSRIRLRTRAYNGPSGSTASQFNASGAMSASIDGLGKSHVHSGNPFLPSGYTANQLRWSDYTDHIVYHDANGYAGGTTTHQVRMGLAYGSINANFYANLTIPRIPRIPSKPNAPVASAVGTTGMTLSWTIPADNGATITEMLLRRYVNADLTGASVDYVNSGTATSRAVTGLDPATTYYWAVYAKNSTGYSDRSNITTQATLPSTPPGLDVAPALNGLSALVTLSPPGGVSGVTQYNLEWRPSGGAATLVELAGTTYNLTGLTPNAVYEYRANAEIGAYTSPWTTWTPVSQPNPNTNPGNYYDGATAPSADLLYAWLATAGLSKSQATAYGVDGWDAVITAPAAGVLYQVSDGFVGAKAARLAFTKDATAAGQWHAGQSLVADSWAEVAGNTVYGFSIYVNPSRSQRLSVRAMFHDGTSEVGGVILGTAQVVPANTWTRISMVTTSPPSATRAAVRVTDVAGTGFSVMLGGQSVLLDGAMVSLGADIPDYIDGALPDTVTFTFDWLGTPFFSASSRTQNITSTVDPLADPDCPPVPSAPRPPVIPSDCVEEVGSWRRYTLQIPDAYVPLWGATLPTLILSTGSAAERQVRIRYTPNPEGLAPELVDKSVWVAEQIVSYIPPFTDVTLDGVSQRAWAEVSGGETVAADRLVFGTGGIPAEWPELECGIAYVVTLDVPTEAPEGNLDTRVLVTQRL